MKFRDLRADEVECRIGTINEKGLTLLLYKDARCDMNILDETAGEENWQREHYEVKGNMYCRVGIYCGGIWVWKSDCGTESYTEKEKGESSDSFKRACVNWGIGRELYTSPFIWISSSQYTPTTVNNKPTTREKFKVVEMEIENKTIVYLKIMNATKGTIVYEYDNKPKLEGDRKALNLTVKTLMGEFARLRGKNIAEVEKALLRQIKAPETATVENISDSLAVKAKRKIAVWLKAAKEQSDEADS